MNKISVFVFKTSVTLILTFTLFSCAQKKQQQIPTQKVDVILAEQKDVISHIEFVGQVYGLKDIPIRARVDGFLDGIHFKEGHPVKKGQLLYTIDPQPFEAEVASYQSKVAEAKTNYAKAESDLNRYKPLAESNAVSQADLDAAQAQFDAAEAYVKAAEANLRSANIKLGYTRISSPIQGIIGKTQARIGEYVGKSQSTVVLNTVSRVDEILVDFYLPENQYLRFMDYLGSADTLFLGPKQENADLELVLADGTIHESKGYFSFFDRAIDNRTGSMLVQARFENKRRIIRPGQYTKVRIPIISNNVIIIPQKCITELQGRYSVFVVNNENKVELHQVTIGKKIDDLWIINEGLKAGDKIIINGIQKVRNGVEVEATEIKFKSQSNSN